MQPFKFKAKTVLGKAVVINSPNPRYKAVTIQAINYNSTNPQDSLFVGDEANDTCLFPVPGQQIPKTMAPDVPVTVAFPLHVWDNRGEIEFVIWGELRDTQLTK